MTVAPSKQHLRTIYPHLFTVALDSDADARVRLYAKHSGVKLATALRELIEYGLESINDHAGA